MWWSVYQIMSRTFTSRLLNIDNVRRADTKSVINIERLAHTTCIFSHLTFFYSLFCLSLSVFSIWFSRLFWSQVAFVALLHMFTINISPANKTWTEDIEENITKKTERCCVISFCYPIRRIILCQLYYQALTRIKRFCATHYSKLHKNITYLLSVPACIFKLSHCTLCASTFTQPCFQYI